MNINRLNNITVILNVYKRVQYLKQQIDAIESQTVKPKDIWIWYNKAEDREQVDLNKDFGKYRIINSNYNFKFHARFALALLAQSGYIAVFDDDTIPGNRWFENCFNTLKEKGNVILGCSGIYLRTNENYRTYKKIGWNGQKSNEPLKADLVGHAWFFKKEILRYLFSEEPYSWDNGEDIQLSFLSYLKAGIETFVPPHPAGDKSLWGSILGQEFGGDENASCKTPRHYAVRDMVVKKYIDRGYIPVKFRT